MKHFTTYLFAFALLSGLFYLTPASANITLNGVEYTLDTLANYPCGPGSEYLSIRMRRVSDRSGRIDAFLMKVDLKNPYVTIEQVLGKDAVIGTETVSSMAKRKTSDTKVYYGGVNGDFFATSGDVGRPTGTTVLNDEFVYTPNNDRRMGGVNDSKRVQIGTDMHFSGQLLLTDTAWTIKHVNYTRKDNQLVLYNQHNGATTLTNAYGYEVGIALVPGYGWSTDTVVKAVVKTVEDGVGSMTIPAGEAVLSAHGTAIPALSGLQVGDTIALSLQLTIDGMPVHMANAIAGDNYATIIHNGQVEQSNFWNELHPRTGFGATQGGDTAIFCVVDGRALSVGVTTKVLGEIMHYNGCYNAVNWDGGGSSHLYLQKQGLMNAGCETSERAVGNGMFAIANVPGTDNTIASICSYDASLRLPKYGVFKPSFLGYNQYGLLVDTDVAGVVLTPSDSTTGYINTDGAFVCLGSGALTATYGTVSTTIPVRLVTDMPISIRLDSVLVSDITRYPVEVQATVGNNTVTLQPSALTWMVDDPTVAEINDGVLHGLMNGNTSLYGQLGDFRDTLPVTVEIAANPLRWSSMQEAASEWTMKPSSSAWKTAITNINDSTAGLYINYNGGRQANIKFTVEKKLYGTPTAFEFRFMPNGFPLSRVNIGLRANNQTDDARYDVQSFNLEDTVRIIIPLDSLFGGEDIAVYPVMFDNMTLYLNTSAASQEYTMTLDGIYLHYGSVAPIECGVESVDATENGHKVVKIFEGGQLLLRCDGKTWTVTGTALSY